MTPQPDHFTPPEEMSTTELIELENGYHELKDLAEDLKDSKKDFFTVQIRKLNKIIKERLEKIF
tara:strand:- start:3586 stop:3777 length:192 start_codon:yes stop_codon:yes gene_type:complete